jgi:hypothetical protein
VPSALPGLEEPTKAILSIPAELTENCFFDSSAQFADMTWKKMYQ